MRARIFVGRMRKSIALLLALAFAAPTGLTVGIAGVSDSPIVRGPGPDTIYIDGDWAITTLQDYWNKTIILRGNLSIMSGGTLELHNSSLRMDCSEDLDFKIDVYSGGALRMYDFDGDQSTTNDTPTITSHLNGPRFSMTAWPGSHVALNNFNISHCGASPSSMGFKIMTNDALLRNGRFSDCYTGLYLSGTSATVSNCIFERVMYGIYSFQSWAMLDNCTVTAPTYYGLWALYGEPTVVDSSISTGWSGIYLNRADATLLRTSVTGFSGPALQCWDSSPLIQDSVLSGWTDIQANGGSYPGLLNCSVSPSKVAAGNGALVSLGSYMPLRVTDSLGRGVVGAKVTVLDSSGLAAWSGTSGADGNATAVARTALVTARGIQNRTGGTAYAYVDRGNWTEAGSSPAASGCIVEVGNSSSIVYFAGDLVVNGTANGTVPYQDCTVIFDGKVYVPAGESVSMQNATVLFDATSVDGASLDVAGNLSSEGSRFLAASASRPLLALPHQLVASEGSRVGFLNSTSVGALEFKVKTSAFSAAGSAFESARSYALRFENANCSLVDAGVLDSAGGVSLVRCQVEMGNVTVGNVVGNAIYSHESRGNVTDASAELAQYGTYLYGSVLNISESTFGSCYVGASASGAGTTVLRDCTVDGSGYAGFEAYGGHRARLERCNLTGNYIGVDAHVSSAWVESSSFSGNHYGLYARSTAPIVSNSTMANVVDVATGRGSRPSLLNTTFDAGALDIADSSYVSVGGFARYNVTFGGLPSWNDTLSICGGFSSGSTGLDGRTGWLPFVGSRHTSGGVESMLPAEVACLHSDANGSRLAVESLALAQGGEYPIDVDGGSDCLVWEDDIEVWGPEAHRNETIVLKADLLVMVGGLLELDGCDLRLWKGAQMSFGAFGLAGGINITSTKVKPFLSATAGTPLAGGVASNPGTLLSISNSTFAWTIVRAHGNLSVRDSTFEDSYEPGIYATSSVTSVENVSVSFCSDGIDAVGSTMAIDGLTVSQCTNSGISASGCAVEASNLSAVGNGYGGHFSGGTSGNLSSSVFSMNENGAYVGSSTLAVMDSTFLGNPGYGLHLDKYSGAVDDLACSGNGAGIAMFDSAPLVSNLSSGGNTYGIYSYRSAPHLRDCSFDGDLYGIYSDGFYSATISAFDSGLDDALESFIGGGSKAKNSLTLPARARVVSASVNISGVDLKKASVNSDRATQMSPALWNDTLVYTESNGQGYDIVAYDLTMDSDGDGIFNYMEYPHAADDPARTKITNDEELDFDADIWGSTIVWSRYDDANGFDVMAHDMALNKTWTVCAEPSANQHSTVWGDVAAWPTVETKYQIYSGAVDGSSQTPVTSNDRHNWFPDLWGDRLVWSDYVGSPGGSEEADVYLLNLTTSDLLKVSDYASQQSLPSVCGDLIVFQDDRQGDTNGDGYNEWGIMVYDIGTRQESVITTDIEASFAPRVHGDKVVWYWHNRTLDDANEANVGWSAYMHNLTTGVTEELEHETSGDAWPVAFGPRVAWTNRTGGYGDIWVYDQRYAGFPSDPWLDVGDDASVEWSAADEYNGTEPANATLLASALGSWLAGGESDASVTVPLRLGSSSTGRIRLSELSVVYRMDGLGERVQFNGSGVAGLQCSDSSFRLVNSTFSGAGTEASLDEGSDVELLNCTFAGIFNFADADSNVTVKNFLHVLAEDECGPPVSGVRVTALDNGVQSLDSLTAADGTARWARLTDRRHNATGVWENETSVSVEFGGAIFDLNPRLVGMSESHWEVFSTDLTRPMHSLEAPAPGGSTLDDHPTISVRVTDASGIVQSSIKLYVDGYMVYYNLSAVPGGFDVSYFYEVGGVVGQVIRCRIVAEDPYGNAVDYSWNFTIVVFFDVQLSAGWNLVSLPLVQVNTSIRYVLASVEGKWDYAMAYDPSDPGDPWKCHYVGMLESLNDLAELDHTMGFWLRMTENATLRVYGLPAGPTAIGLRAGWNLVGYPTLAANVSAGVAFWGSGADIVEAFDPGETYLTKAVGPVYTLKPGEAYWVHVSTDAIWTVSW